MGDRVAHAHHLMKSKLKIFVFPLYSRASSADKLVGAGLLSLSLAIFVYYTLWVIILPFVDTSHPVQDFFLPRKYAIAIPTVLVIMLVAFVAVFIGLTLMKSARKPKKKAA